MSAANALICPSSNELAEFAEGLLEARARQTMEHHLDHCEPCRRVVGQLIAFGGIGHADASAILAPGTPVDHYVIMRAEGVGGMGRVYRAYDTQLDRNVALKFLHGPAGGDAHRHRLRGEAKSLAKLSHPNVVTIYEVGEWCGRDYLAMEFIGGAPLSTWLGRQPRGWREIVAVFAAAGRGLAAAHRAGLVHRDFKPSNVLIEPQGRVCVVDFGLSRQLADRGVDLESAPPGDAGERPTGQGAVLGTPHYMAPEQRTSAAVDARADQYSFCLALGEALERTAPRAPARLRAVTARGLAADPNSRYPTMDALLAALTAATGSRDRRRSALVVAFCAALAPVVLWLAVRASSSAPPPTCVDPRPPLGDLWGEAQRRAVGAAFESTGVSYAASTATRVDEAIASYSGRWASARRQICEATHLRGTQSAELLDERMACLERGRAELKALVAVLAGARDRAVVDRAVPAVGGLSDVRACVNGREPVRAAPPAIARRVAELSDRLRTAEALGRTGLHHAGVELAESVAGQADALLHAPLQGDAQYRLAALRQAGGDYEQAATAAGAALMLAARVQDDGLAARALVTLLQSAVSRARYESAQSLAESADAAVLRAGDDDLLRARWHEAVATLQLHLGQPKRARANFEQTLALRERAGEIDGVIRALRNLGVVANQQRDYSAAQDFYTRALELARAHIGPVHPDLARIAEGLGNTHMMLAQYERAAALYGDALRMQEVMFGERSLAVAAAQHELAAAEQQLGHRDRALAGYRRALELRRAQLGPDHPLVAQSLVAIGNALIGLDRAAEAIEPLERALAIERRALPAGHPTLMATLGTLGGALRSSGRPKEALVHLREAVAIGERSSEASPVHLIAALVALGRNQLALGRTRVAADTLQRALALAESDRGGGEPRLLAEIRSALAGALWDSGADRARALDLMRRAREGYASLGPGQSERRRVVEAWLADRSGAAGRRQK